MMRAILLVLLCLFPLESYAGGGPINPCSVTVNGISFTVDLPAQPTRLRDGKATGAYCSPDWLAQLYPSGSILQVTSPTLVDGNPAPVIGIYSKPQLAQCTLINGITTCRDVLGQPHQFSTTQFGAVQSAITAGQVTVSVP